MNDDVYFSELRRSLFPPEHNLFLSHDHNAPMKPINYVPKTAGNEMIIGPWYLDEFGNPTREIKARD